MSIYLPEQAMKMKAGKKSLPRYHVKIDRLLVIFINEDLGCNNPLVNIFS